MLRKEAGRRSTRLSTVGRAAHVAESRILTARLAIMTTIAGWVGYLVYWFYSQFLKQGAYTTQAKAEAITYLAMITLLEASSLAYLVSRLGHIYRAREHRRVPRANLDAFFWRRRPNLTMIIPSYREETRVIRNTLLSAALQEYPAKRIVLLIDDPPHPTNPHHRTLLEAARELPEQLEELLAYPSSLVRDAYEQFLARLGISGDQLPILASTEQLAQSDDWLEEVAADPVELEHLAQTYDLAASWLTLQGEELPILDHTDAFLRDEVFVRLAVEFSQIAQTSRQAAQSGREVSAVRIAQLYERLINVFTAQVSSFERKQYASLSAEPNKAMNLNSYIGLMGGAYSVHETLAGKVLVADDPEHASLVVPNPDYVLTLDADSTLLPEYCLRLVYLLEQEEFLDVAIAQTPYSAYPGASSRLERIAGATTDVQHVDHQGLANYRAGFWVGANAVIRKRALDSLEEISWEGGYPVKRYIRDRTAIEDTESSIDIAAKGWTIYNYPERLSYSATPPDFGALCIQRRRWADGGLLVVPKLWRYHKRAKEAGRQSFAEFFLRMNYLASITWTTVALIVLLVFPFANELVSPWIAVLALPYFFAMSTDLKYAGYRRRDIFAIYGFNLILVMVNLAGTVSSIGQAVTGARATFARTPKIRKRTVTPLLFVVSPYVLVGLALYTLVHDWEHHALNSMLFAAINVVLASYAILAFIGVRHSIQDIWVQVLPWFQRRQRSRGADEAPQVAVGQGARPDPGSWEHVVELGHALAPAALAVADTPARVRGGAKAERDRQRRLNQAYSVATLAQPIVDIQRDVIVGYELLHRVNGAPPPSEFARLGGADVVSLEQLLLDRSAQVAPRLPDGSWLNVNISRLFVRELGDGRRVPLADRSGVFFDVSVAPDDAPSSSTVGDGAFSRASLRVSISLDDVVPDALTLSLVRQVRPRMIKLDPNWVHELWSSPAKRAQTQLLLRLVGDDSLVVAEGVEEERELAVLRELGVRFAQGYLLGKPRSLDDEQLEEHGL
jgi:cellulose synthase/poly-beta-1,6-N-acetylglucosamine synthase-like glycosyltransferase/EAL domain-containing protein (putative c-di-GMP-specific phosphodiesterase class I)